MNEFNPKTQQIKKISSVEPNVKLKKPSIKNNGYFDKILNKNILTNQSEQSNESIDNTSFTKALPEIESSFNAQRLNLEPDQTQFTENLADSLNMLEKYADQLQNPNTTLKQAHAFLEQVSTKTEKLENELSHVFAPNKDLKKILTQLTTLVKVEQIKLNRGDYSD